MASISQRQYILAGGTKRNTKQGSGTDFESSGQRQLDVDASSTKEHPEGTVNSTTTGLPAKFLIIYHHRELWK